jgi:hypothetical protein
MKNSKSGAEGTKNLTGETFRDKFDRVDEKISCNIKMGLGE